MKESIVVVFIYEKNKKIKVLDIEDSKKNHKILINDGWMLTTTLDTCRFLEQLYNNIPEDEILYTIKSLAK